MCWQVCVPVYYLIMCETHRNNDGWHALREGLTNAGEHVSM